MPKNKPEQSAERIERAATELFADHGFDAVGVRDIARNAGVPVSAINYYFGSKESLYRECTRKLTREYVDEARELLDSGGDLSAILEHYVDFGAKRPRLIKMWLDLQLSGEEESYAYANREILTPVWQILSRAIEAEGGAPLDRRLGVLSFVGAVILGAILTDDQMESLTTVDAGAARDRWRDEIMERFGGLRAVAAPERLRVVAE